MKFIGFIKNYHQNIENSALFKDIEYEAALFDKSQIIQYLENGTKIAVSMHVIESLFIEDKTVIGGLIYFSFRHSFFTNSNFSIPFYFVLEL